MNVEDLEPEGLDDMMRAATELSEFDVKLLNLVLEMQLTTSTEYTLTSGDGTINRPRGVWQALESAKVITLQNQMDVRSSLARLQAFGFGAEIQTTDSTWHPRFLVSPKGEKFLKYIMEAS